MLSPFVSGVSPREGPPGTLITVRGENLGIDLRDVISVKICGVEMVLTFEWVSSSKITVRSGMGVGVGDIIVTTKSGGEGGCSVNFKGDHVSQVHPKQEVAVFVDETHTFLTAWDKRRPVVEDFPGENLLGLSDEGTERKFPKKILDETFPNSSGDITTENFSASWYLLEKHSENSFEDLKAGLETMKCRKSHVSSEPLTFAKTYLSTFMDCQDALVTMHNKLTWDENQKVVTLEKLNMLLQAADKDADFLFHDIIRRKEKADATRNALGILNRFKFLFYLPPLMRKKISKGEFDVVINDYNRAKLLFKDTEVAAFQKVYAEVEKEIKTFMESLHNSLLEMPAPIDDKKRIIRHLVDLEYAGDAAWECICRHHSWLMDEMAKIREEHTAREHDEFEYGVNFSKANRLISTAFKDNAQSNNTPTVNHPSADANQIKMKTPQRIIFVERLSECLTDFFPDFCRLGHAYLEGHLPRKEREDTHKAKTQLQTKSGLLKQMTTQILQLYCNLVRRAFLPDSLETLSPSEKRALGEWTLHRSEIPSAWLPHCVRTVRFSAEKIRDDVPVDTDISNPLEELVFDLRTDTMKTILKQAMDDVLKLRTKEHWQLDTNDSLGSRSQLPTLFEHCVNDAVNNLNNIVMKVKTGEQDIFNDQGIQQQATLLFIKIVEAYIKTLERCAFNSSESKINTSSLADQSVDDSNTEGSLAQSRRLIITLSNCHYTQKKLIPRLIETLDKNGFQETRQIMQFAEASFGELYSKLFDNYVEIKLDPIIGSMEERMYIGEFDWSTSKEPTDVRSYIKESVTQIVEVHSEVYTILPLDIIPEVMVKVVEYIAKELNRLMYSITKFNKHGALQAKIDILAFKQATKNFLSNVAEEDVDEVLERIPASSQHKEEMKVSKIQDQFSKQLLFSFLAFEPNA